MYKILVNKICPSCNKPFRPSRPSQIYCGKHCSGSHPGWFKPLINQERICPQCGKSFYPNSPNHLYCTKECLDKNYHKRLLELYGGKFICDFCGNKYEPSIDSIRRRLEIGNTKQYCGLKCAGIASHHKYTSMQDYIEKRNEWISKHGKRYCFYCGEKIDENKVWEFKKSGNRGNCKKTPYGKYCSNKCFSLDKRTRSINYTEEEIQCSLRRMAAIIRKYFLDNKNGNGISNRAYGQFLTKSGILFLKQNKNGKIMIVTTPMIINKITKNRLNIPRIKQ